MLSRSRVRSAVRAACVALVVVTASPAFAALPRQEATGVGSLDVERLARDVDARFRVALLESGIILIPRSADRGFASIEISGGAVAIDGTAATGREVRSRLGQDAGSVLALSYLDVPVLHGLFRGSSAAAPAEPAAAPPIAIPAPVPAPPPAPTEPRIPERRRESWFEHPRNVRSDGRVRIGGDVRIAEDELVRGPVVAVFGSAVIDGAVEDDVVAVGGSVRLGPRAEIRGDVTAVGGGIDRDPGATVRGQLHEVGFTWPRIGIAPLRWPWARTGRVFDAPFSLLFTAMRMAFFALLVVLVAAVARRPVERIAGTVAAAPWTSAAVGVLAQFAALPVLILVSLILLVSIIGIPLLAVIPPLMVLGLLVAFLVGFAGVAFGLGRWAAAGFRFRASSLAGVVGIGLFAVWIITLSGRLMALVAWPVWGVSAALLAVGFLVEYVAWTVGLGAALITRFGTRGAPAGVPAVPDAPAFED